LIHYLDTSALVKRYVQEPGSAAVRPLFRGNRVTTARIAHAEIAATLARLCRDGRLTDTARDRIFERLEADFSALSVVEIRTGLVRKVPSLVVRHPLRGYDAVHLAAALAVRDTGNALTFWAADIRLTNAAQAEGLRTVLLS
jgi:predicted nucleic acid-binding protein